MQTNNPIITVDKLVTQFGSEVLHDQLDFSVSKGEIIGIVGGSGSGKSVLMRTMIGLKKADGGSITINANTHERGQFGVLFQHGALFSGLTVIENVMVPLKENTDIDAATARDLAATKLAMAGYPSHSYNKYPSQLSGGMIKRAALARALALDPPILFLDEPTAGLDPLAATDFDQLILTLRDGLALTVIIITHDLDTLATICDRIAVLADKKLTIGTWDELEKAPNDWIKEYFNGPRARAAAGLLTKKREPPHGT